LLTKNSIIPEVITRLRSPDFVSFNTLRTQPDVGITPTPAQIDRYLLASKETSTCIYRIGDVFEELKPADFNLSGGTIASGTLLGGAVWAQILAKEIRVYDAGRPYLQLMVAIQTHQLIDITDDEFGLHSRIRSAFVVDPWILVILDNGSVLVYEMNVKTKDLELHPKMSTVSGEFVCAFVFQGRKGDFLPRKVVKRSSTLTAGAASLKRKRDFDEDVDLYGDTEMTEKTNGDSEESETMTSEPQTNGVTLAEETESDETEWLLFLVSQEGELQVRLRPHLT
jgi:hypothetical protein